jgi:hypothetical protein
VNSNDSDERPLDLRKRMARHREHRVLGATVDSFGRFTPAVDISRSQTA